MQRLRSIHVRFFLSLVSFMASIVFYIYGYEIYSPLLSPYAQDLSAVTFIAAIFFLIWATRSPNPSPDQPDNRKNG